MLGTGGKGEFRIEIFLSDEFGTIRWVNFELILVSSTCIISFEIPLTADELVELVALRGIVLGCSFIREQRMHFLAYIKRKMSTTIKDVNAMSNAMKFRELDISSDDFLIFF